MPRPKKIEDEETPVKKRRTGVQEWGKPVKVEEWSKPVAWVTGNKTKHYRTKTYKNGVKKTKLIAVTKETPNGEITIYSKGAKE